MRRIGNRLALAIARWRRECRKSELLRFRQRWALKFREYECIGGPLDGHVRICNPCDVILVAIGFYSIDLADCRLHYHASSAKAEAYRRHWSGQ